MNKTKQLVLSALLIAIGLILPFFTGQIPQIGSQLAPMHFPILVCGMILGPKIGFFVGFTTPLLRSVLFGMPSIVYATCMAFELATYGLVSGYLYQRQKQNIYVSLMIAMIAGRVVWGIASYIIHTSFTLTMFINGALLTAFPGIILQLLIVPFLVRSIKKIT